MSEKMSFRDRQTQFFNMIRRGTPQTPRENIYSQAYRIRFPESLQEDYPVASKLDLNFEKRMARFCSEFGSESWSLNHLAMTWMNYLIQDQASNMEPWLLDLYQLECLQFQSYFLDEKSALQSGRIQIDGEVYLEQTQAFYWMKSSWDVEQIWQSEKPPQDPKASVILFYQQDGNNTFQTVQGLGADILEHVLTAKSLTSLPEHLQNPEGISVAFSHLSPLFQAREF